MRKNLTGVAAIALVAAMALTPSAHAADARVPRHAAHQRVYEYNDGCGCWHVTIVYHRELLYTYGWNVDPRKFDQTEPYYYHGAVRAYPRFW